MQYIRVGQWFAVALVAAFTQFVAADVRAGEFLLPLNGDNVIGAVSIAVAENDKALNSSGSTFVPGQAAAPEAPRRPRWPPRAMPGRLPRC